MILLYSDGEPYRSANQKLCFIQVLISIEKSGEQDQERSEEWLVNTDPDVFPNTCTSLLN